MKYAIITSNSYFSSLILSKLLETFHEQIGVIIEARGMIKGKSTSAMLLNVLKRSGFRGFCYKIGTATFSRFLDKISRVIPGNSRIYSPLAHATRLGIPVETFSDTNNEACLARLRAVQPDLIFGVNVYQRLKAPILELPRIGIVNCHFGMLPFYRGMSPYMWALANDEDSIGITAHFMDEEFDTGDIIIQKSVPILHPDSAYALYIRGCLVARTILAEIASMAEEGKIHRTHQPKSGSYYSLPGPDCIRAIRRNGHKLVRLKDLLRVIIGRIE